MACSANYGLAGTETTWNGIPVFPHGGDDDVAIPTYAEYHEADIVITVQDAWTRHPERWPHLRVAMWAPVDHYPIPPKVLAVLGHDNVVPIAMSQFGYEWMKKYPQIKDRALYAPHAVDTALFRPYPEHRDIIRDGMGISRDAFLVGMVAANKGWNAQLSRKAFPQIIEAFTRFCRRHPDAHLFCQTELKHNRGVDLDSLITVRSIVDSEVTGQPLRYYHDHIHFPSSREMEMGLKRPLLAAQYSAFDVLANASMGEGFGVPILEAQACGVPVIVSDHSAMPELCHAGWLVEGDPFWDGPQESFAFIPHVASIEAALEAAYEAREDQALRDSAVEWAQGYEIDHVVETYWLPILETLSKPREVPPLPNRAMRRAAKKNKVAA